MQSKDQMYIYSNYHCIIDAGVWQHNLYSTKPLIYLPLNEHVSANSG